MKTSIVLPIKREDVRKSFGAFAKRGYQGCNHDCVMDEAVRRIFVCEDTETSYQCSFLYAGEKRLGSVEFAPIADVPNSVVAYTHPAVYDDACMAAAKGDMPKNADEIYRHLVGKMGKLVEFTYDTDKVKLRS